jgi:hypothetical protein
MPLAAPNNLSKASNESDNIVSTFTGKAIAGAPNAVGIGIAFITLTAPLTVFTILSKF